jgi:chaperonin GroEL
MLMGIHLIANVVKPTLGPLPRLVGIEGSIRDRPPELLDNAAIIARRIIQIAHPTADVGAMMMRHALWRMHEICGDGAATMAVIAQAILEQANKAIAAGRHPALIRRGIEQGVKQATAQLSAATIRPVGGRQARDFLMALARTSCSDSELRDILVEVVSIIGADGAVQVVNHDGRGIAREYIEGALWDSPWLATGFATESDKVARLTDGAVVLLDGKLDAADNVLQGMRRLYELGYRSALIVAGDLSDEVKALLIQAKLNNVMYVLPVKAPGVDARRAAALQDLAVLTGARVLFGDSAAFARLAAEDVGSVRRAWANARQFGIIGGRRDPFALRAAIAAMRKRIDETTDLDEISELRLRLGRLSGGIAILRVGGVTNSDQEQRREQAVRLARLLQMASAGGYLAGGGAALFKTSEALCASGDARNGDDIAVGFRCLAQALTAPLMTIAANAGFDPRAIADRVRVALRASPNSSLGFDVRRGEVTDLIAAGVVDAAEVLIRAVQVAGSLAATAITTTAVVHHRKPETATKP